MVFSGEVVGFKVFQSGAANLFVSVPAKDSDKCRSGGFIVYSVWQARGTYDFSNLPDFLGATARIFVGQNESGVIELAFKGGENR